MIVDWENQRSPTQKLIRDGIAAGLQIGAQIFVSRDGKTLIDGAIGDARPGVAMRRDTLMLWLSAGKPIAAAAIMQLHERGLLDLSDPAARRLPEFGANGKDAVTIRHILTHTAGFRFLDLGDASTAWDEKIRRIANAPLERNWIPGRRAGYHPYTSWYVLGEIVARLSGLSFSDYVRERIFLPLGMNDCWIGMPPAVRDAYGDRLGALVNTEKREDAGQPSLTPHLLGMPEAVVQCVPGAGGFGPIRELARFYEMLLAGGEFRGVRVLAPESVERLKARERVGMLDETFKHTLDWGLGTIPNNRRYGLDTVPYGYGRHAGDDAVGHSGSQSSVAFADPTNRLAVAVVLNGTCGERAHQPRMRAVLESIYQELGITRSD